MQQIKNRIYFMISAGFLYMLMVACNAGSGTKGNKSDADTTAISKNSTDMDTSTTVAKPKMENPEEEEDIDLTGKIVPNLKDTTLLRLVYGNYIRKGKEYMVNNGAQLWDKSDSIYMKVAERLGDDSTKLIYIRGEAAITDVMHNHYVETTLLFHRIKTGWEVKDYSKDDEVIDYSEVHLAGIYNNRFLIKYMYSGVFAGGVLFADDAYFYMSRDSLTAPSIVFISESSNTASNQCDSTEGEDSKSCDCYRRGGEVTFHYDKKLKYLVFNYNFKNTQMDCGRINPSNSYATQTWYMNADTSFQAIGNILSEWGDEIKGKINLSETEIAKRLYSKKQKD